jgi:WD40 repeat protein
VIGDVNGQIKIYNQNSSLALVNSFQAHSSYINRIKQSPCNTNTNTNYVATCSDERTVKIWNLFNWTIITIYTQHSSNVYTLEWLDNDTLASADWRDKTIKLWSMTKDQTVPKKKDNESLKGFFETIRPLTIVSYSVP